MSAPWSVELDKDILGVVVDNLVELLGNEDNNGLILSLRDGCALDGRLERSINELLYEWSNSPGGEGDALVEGVLELLGDILDDECGPFALEEVHGFAVLGELDGINPDKVDFALERLGETLERADDGVLVSAGGVNEDVSERESGFGIGGIVLAGDLIEERGGVLLQPCAEVEFVNRGDLGSRVFIASLIERLVDDNGWGRNIRSGSDGRVRDETEEILFTVLFSNLGECGDGSL